MKAFVIKTCCLWHKDVYEIIGVATKVEHSIRIVKEHLKKKGLKLDSDNRNMLLEYKQTQGLMRSNNYPSNESFEIILEEFELNKLVNIFEY